MLAVIGAVATTESFFLLRYRADRVKSLRNVLLIVLRVTVPIPQHGIVGTWKTEKHLNLLIIKGAGSY